MNQVKRYAIIIVSICVIALMVFFEYISTMSWLAFLGLRNLRNRFVLRRLRSHTECSGDDHVESGSGATTPSARELASDTVDKSAKGNVEQEAGEQVGGGGNAILENDANGHNQAAPPPPAERTESSYGTI